MKINQEHFKSLSNGKDIINVLQEMDAVGSSDSAVPLYQQLMKLFAEAQSPDAVSVVFPYLVQLAEEKKDLLLANLVVNTKLGFYHRGNLDALSPKQMQEYLGCLYHLRNKFPVLVPGLLDNQNDEFVSSYLWNATMLHSFGKEAYLFSALGQFKGPFQVKCRHCGDDKHKLEIVGSEPSKTEGITPAGTPEPWEKLFCDELYPFMLEVCALHNETLFQNILPYFFGTYQCPDCGKENQVADAFGCHIRETQPWCVMSLAHLQQLEMVAARVPSSAERWEFTKFIVAQYRIIEGNKSPRALSFYFRHSMQFWNDYSDEMKEGCLNYAKAQIEFVPEDSSLYGDLWQYLGNLYEKAGKLQAANAYYDKSLAHAKESYGLEAGESLGIQESIAFCKSRQLEKDKEAPLLEVYDLVKKHGVEKPVRLNLFRIALRQCYESQEKFVEATQVQEDIISMLTNEKGLGEQQYLLACLYQKAGETAKAKDLWETSLLTCLKTAGVVQGEKSLPKPPKAGSATALRFAKDVLHVGLSSSRLAEVAFQANDMDKVGEMVRRGRMILEWGIPVPVTVKGDLLLLDAQRLFVLSQEKGGEGNLKVAEDTAKRAQKVYELTAKRTNNKPAPEVEIGLAKCQEFLAKISGK